MPYILQCISLKHIKVVCKRMFFLCSGKGENENFFLERVKGNIRTKALVLEPSECRLGELSFVLAEGCVLFIPFPTL